MSSLARIKKSIKEDGKTIPPTALGHRHKYYTEQLKTLQELMVKQSKGVETIVSERGRYDPEETFLIDGDGYHTFPNMRRDKRELKGASKARAEDLKRRREEWAASAEPLPPGMHAERVPVPFLIEQFPTGSVRGNVWTDEINDKIDSFGLNLPRAPFVWIFLGGINAGKTNLMAHALSFYAHHGAFQHIWYVSPIGLLDPTIASIQCIMPPTVKFEVFEAIPMDKIQWAKDQVIMQNMPLMRAAMVGKYKEAPDHSNRALRDLLPAPDLNAPMHDQWDNPLVHKTRLPNELLRRVERYPNSFFTPSVLRNLHNPYETDETAQKGIGLSLEDVPHPSTQQQRAELEKSSGPQAPLQDPMVLFPELVTMGSSNASSRDASLYDSATHRYWSARNPYQAMLYLDHSHFKAGKADAGVFREEGYRNFLLVCDDVNRLFKGAGLALANLLGPEIRHYHGSAFAAAQKSTMVPPIVRAQASYVSIAPTREHLELDRIRKDYGSNIPNFDRVFKYCTTPTDTMPNPFMFIDNTTVPPGVFKGFEEQINWDANVIEISKRNTKSAMQQDCQPGSSTQHQQRSTLSQPQYNRKPAGAPKVTRRPK